MSAQKQVDLLTFVREELIGSEHNTGNLAVSDNVDRIDFDEILSNIGNRSTRSHFKELLIRHWVSRGTHETKVVLVILCLLTVKQKVE